jgi:hypothetical protein
VSKRRKKMDWIAQAFQSELALRTWHQDHGALVDALHGIMQYIANNKQYENNNTVDTALLFAAVLQHLNPKEMAIMLVVWIALEANIRQYYFTCTRCVPHARVQETNRALDDIAADLCQQKITTDAHMQAMLEKINNALLMRPYASHAAELSATSSAH